MNITLDQNRIRIIDGFISSSLCHKFIENFELAAGLHQQRRSEWVNLTELELWNSRHGRAKTPWQKIRQEMAYDWTKDTDQVGEKLFAAAELYRARWGQLDGVPLLPTQFSMEGMRIKCYRPNGEDQFRLHVDVADRASSGRFVSFLLYLNDSDAGTEFPLEKLTVEAREGRLVIFPPLWTYPHLGQMPRDGGTKYILSTYLHYL